MQMPRLAVFRPGCLNASRMQPPLEHRNANTSRLLTRCPFRQWLARVSTRLSTLDNVGVCMTPGPERLLRRAKYVRRTFAQREEQHIRTRCIIRKRMHKAGDACGSGHMSGIWMQAHMCYMMHGAGYRIPRTFGIAAACTGVGAVRPRFARALSNRGSRPVASKVAIGFNQRSLSLSRRRH